MKKLLFLPMLAILASGCSRYYYKPNAVNAPLFTGGNQFHIAGAGMVTSEDYSNNDKSYEGNFYFFDLQAAYSPINHLGIIGNYSTYAYRANEPRPAEGHVDADGHLAEIGVGGYLSKGNGKTKLVVDIYAGGGGGKLASDIDMNVRKLFIQPGIGMRHPAVELSFNMRVSNIKFSNLDDNGLGMNYLIDQGILNLARDESIEENSHFFWEPAFTVRTGYKFIKAQFQLATSAAVTHKTWKHSGSRFTIGLHFNVEDAIAEFSK